VENLAMKNFWLDRPTFVTGATGLVGGWLVKRLVEAGADVVCLIRDWVPQSEIARTNLIERVKVVRGDVRDQTTLERVLCESQSCFNLGDKRAGHMGFVGSVPPHSHSQADRDGVVRQSLRR
jgi:nucleoside-diphosphate-sugar epimerase